MSAIYDAVRKAITGMPSSKLGPWERPSLVDSKTAEHNVDTLPVLSEISKEGLMRVFSSLKPISSAVMERLKESRKRGGVSAAEKIMAFAGLAYGMNFYSPGTIGEMRSGRAWCQPAYLAIQPLLRRPAGIAGLNFDPDGRLFKVERGQNALRMTPEAVTTRALFQTSYVRSLGLNVGGW